jgi:hypothetical protein
MINQLTLFSQLIKQVPKEKFNKILAYYNAEKHSKGFKSWTQFVSMLFCHLAKADSLRDICNGLSSFQGKLNHIAITNPNKSSLAYANEKRDSNVYKDLFWQMMEEFKSNKMLSDTKKPKFKFKNKLLSLDSTTITLSLSMFNWAKYRKAKGGVKVHILLDHDTYMPSYINISTASIHDVNIAKSLAFNPGSIVVMDKGYNDYKIFNKWNTNGIYFVTRIKDNASYKVLSTYKPLNNKYIISDDIIKLSAEEKYLNELRKIKYFDGEKSLEFLTNNFELEPQVVAEIYKDRWEIELFFKLLKQNLKIKTFIGTSKNALETQIWTAMIVLLLIKWLHFISNARWSFSNLYSMLRINLFNNKDLMLWLHNPFGKTPEIELDKQLKLFT